MKDKKSKIRLFQAVARLLPFMLAGAPGLFISCNIIALVHGVSHGLMTFVSQRFFDSVANAVSQNTAISAVIWMGTALGVTVIGTQVLNGVHNFLSNALFKKEVGYLTMRINRKAQSLDPVCYENTSMLDDISKAQEGAQYSAYLVFMTATIFTFYIPYFLFMALYLFSLKPILALSIVFVFVPVMATQLVRSASFAKLADQSAPVRREFEYYEKCICDREYFKETRILGGFSYFRNLYRSALSLLGKKIWSAESKTGLLELGTKLLTLAGYFGVLYMLFDALLAGEITIGAFSAVFTSIGLLFSIMDEMICNHIGELTKNIGSVRNFINYIDLPERRGEDRAVDAGDGVVLEHASFRYPGAGQNALDGVTLRISKGETVAIVGENGAGKTTLVRLITGIYTPTEGTARIGGADTSEISAQSIMGGISAVFQKYQRYKMTLGENIAISSEQEQSGMLEEACGKANLDTGEQAFPQKFDTMLSREFDGVDLSGGQWQRVAIARGFYRAHGMIVLDEPTAAIDPLEETRIYQQFSELSRGKTAVVVTHRLGSAKIADRIIVMDKGRIDSEGTHDELMRCGGLYAEMFRAQAKWYEREEEEAG